MDVVNDLIKKFPAKTEQKNFFQQNNMQLNDLFGQLSNEDQLTCINCLALSLDFASSENNVTSFIAHISPFSLNQSRLQIRYDQQLEK